MKKTEIIEKPDGTVEEKKVKGDGKKLVKIQWKGLAPWTLAYRGRANVTVFPNQTVTLNMLDKQDLKHLIEVIKVVNSSTNEQTRVLVSKFGKQHEELYNKWNIIEGKEHIPKLLMGITYDVRNCLTDEVQEAITDLVPTYFDPDPRAVKRK
jgi:hypothetical protein